MGLAFSRTGYPTWYPTLKIPHIYVGIKVSGTETIIKFIGHLASGEVAQQLRSARIFITTSFAEGCPDCFTGVYGLYISGRDFKI
jgi:hypothetical protein